MTFHGRVKFWCYNPSKPMKYHIKLFEVNDARTGYCLALTFTQGKSTQLDVHKMCDYLILHVTRQQKIFVSTKQLCQKKKWKKTQRVTACLGEKVQCYVLDGKKRSLSLCLQPYVKP